MTINIRVPENCKHLVGGNAVVEVEAETVRAALAALVNRYPPIKDRIMRGEGIRRVYDLLLNGESILRFHGMDTRLWDADTLVFERCYPSGG